MKSSVIVFPGSNCDRDVAVALENFKLKIKWFGMTKQLTKIRFSSFAWWFLLWGLS